MSIEDYDYPDDFKSHLEDVAEVPKIENVMKLDCCRVEDHRTPSRVKKK